MSRVTLYPRLCQAFYQLSEREWEPCHQLAEKAFVTRSGSWARMHFFCDAHIECALLEAAEVTVPGCDYYVTNLPFHLPMSSQEPGTQ